MKILYFLLPIILLFNYCLSAQSPDQILNQVRDLKQEILRLRQQQQDLISNFSLKQPERAQRVEHKDNEIQGILGAIEELWATLPEKIRLDHAGELEELYTVGAGY